MILYKCKTCGKDFKTYQGLGGHTSLAHRDTLKKIAKSNTLNRITIKKNCLKCNSIFEVERTVNKDGTQNISKKEKKFCSRSCANGHIQTKEQNKKRSEKLKGKTFRKYKRPNPCYCVSCGIQINNKNKTKKCKNCWNENTSKIRKYRHRCSFKFNVYDYPKEFNLKLLEECDWYSASNRGNNLNGISRDHMISVRHGFDNDILPEIISHPANCQLLKHSKNNKKNIKCSITYKELLERIEQWNKKYDLVANQQTR